MALAVQGIRVPSVNITRLEGGDNLVSGSYELISTTDRVLCKQGFNGYDNMKITWSKETVIALNALLTSIKKDIQTTLGITEEI